VIRRLLAGLIVVGLAVGIWALWPKAGSDPTPTTMPVAVETTTTTTMAASTTSSPTTSSTTTGGSHVVTTVEEAEEILRSLWLGWFEGIYNQDEDRIREVVGTQPALDNARSQFGVMDFERAPQPGDISVSGSEILAADEECLAIWATLTLSGFRTGESTAVHVLRSRNSDWVSVGLWEFKDDLWNQDCRADLEPLS
jgi:hypothetical protein